jgi:hypoxanthine-DNA glycosylase
MGDLVGAGPALAYEARLLRLVQGHVALWDVCASASRDGSLDAAIRRPQPNDFLSFFHDYPALRGIGFNGRSAAALFQRYVLPTLPDAVKDMPRVLLPSTSPAHARLSFEQKRDLWRQGLGPWLLLRN